MRNTLLSTIIFSIAIIGLISKANANDEEIINKARYAMAAFINSVEVLEKNKQIPLWKASAALDTFLSLQILNGVFVGNTCLIEMNANNTSVCFKTVQYVFEGHDRPDQQICDLRTHVSYETNKDIRCR